MVTFVAIDDAVIIIKYSNSGKLNDKSECIWNIYFVSYLSADFQG